MSVECSGYDQNLIYVNFEVDSPPDADNTRCECERSFSSALLSDLSKYMVSVNRFSVPLHTCYMNSEIRNALMITTFDPMIGRPMPACLALDKFEESKENPGQVDWGVE